MLVQIHSMVLFLWYAALALHPLHISITNIDFEKKDGQIDISMKLFKDDFKQALSAKAQQTIDIEDEMKQKENDSIINKYVEENFSLEMDGRKIKLTLKDKKIDPDAVWLNFTVEYPLKVDQLKVENRLLTHLYKDQKNLVIVNFDSRQKGFTLSNDESVFSLNLN